MAAGILTFREAYSDLAARGCVVHPGSGHLPPAPGATATPFTEL